VQAIGETVKGYEASALFGMGAPAKTPKEIIAKLNAEINAALASPAAQKRLAELGETPLGGSAAEFGKIIADETERWGKVVKFSGARID
jgi:tripartite-type tricarboxylate transporter receptor subunit TctC